MTNDELKNLINDKEPEFLPKGKVIHGKQSYVCPCCKNGSGKTKTGIVYNKKDNHWKCFNCGLHEDTIGLYQKYYNVGYIQALNELGGSYGFTSGEGATPRSCTTFIKASTPKKPTAEQPKKDYTKDYEKWHSRIHETDYLQRRGISPELLDKYNIGFTGTKIIIPLDSSVYVARKTREDIPKNERYNYSDGSTATLFNATGLYIANYPIWITEGAIDALSIMECGAECTAVGLNSLANINLLKKQIDINRPTQKLLIAFDNEPEALAKGEELESYLRGEGIECKALNLYYNFGCKDANECLTKNRELFIKTINELQEWHKVWKQG